MPPKALDIFKAAATGDFLVVHKLIEAGEKPDSVDHEGWTAAGRAAQKGRDGVIKVMLDHGLDPKLTGDLGISLLHVAAMHSRELVVKLLIKAGADPNVQADSGKTPLDLCTNPSIREAMEEMDTESEDADGTYVEGQQVFCRDRQNSWWPAIIKTVKSKNMYDVHFPGFGARDDVAVGPEALLSVNLANIRKLEEEFREQHEAAIAAGAIKPPKRKRRAPASADGDSTRRSSGREKRKKVDASDVLGAFDAVVAEVHAARKKVQEALRSGVTIQDAGPGAAEQEKTIAELTAKLKTSKALVAKKDREMEALQARTKKELAETDTIKFELTQLNKVLAKVKKELATTTETLSDKDRQLARLAQDKSQITQDLEQLKNELERKASIIDRIGSEKLQLLQKISAMESHQ